MKAALWNVSKFPQRDGAELLARRVRVYRLLHVHSGYFARHPSQKTDAELKGLVYSLTPKIVDHNAPIYQKPAVVGIVLLIVCIILNFIFW